jgi:hypothetical protein
VGAEVSVEELMSAASEQLRALGNSTCAPLLRSPTVWQLGAAEEAGRGELGELLSSADEQLQALLAVKAALAEQHAAAAPDDAAPSGWLRDYLLGLGCCGTNRKPVRQALVTPLG